ncbi:efflux RND transporter periplasmic adaptor subunit [Gimesia fumaroli]|uniref:Macrolide export protein MacA n=1 Tax=Gimesia fumaroli TaxID=2527976 RepID=A0A518I5H2_9PLAN|nr:efflux RND transporter periplasmic adaptor subunit [Gimesia fumaroli]QDV48349.1 Macrolide export protein MacA [Gimesia fumaroli]
MKTIVRVMIFVTLAGGIAGGSWYWKARQQDTNDDTLVLYGNVDIRQVELAINGSERVGRILVEEGDFVEQKQLLAELELERFELKVARAKAQIEIQQQVVARLEAGTRPEEIRQAEASLLSAKAEYDDAAATLKRILALREKKAVSLQEVDDAKSKCDSAAANAQLLQASLDLAKAGPRKEDIAEAKAVLKRMEIELAQAKHDLKDASLYAPSRGIIQERILEVGDMASPQKPVFTFAFVDPVWVRAYVSEPDLGKIHDGMKAVVITDSFPGKEYEAWVGFISPTAEFTPKPVETAELRTKLVYQVRVFVKNPKSELRLGMPATVKIKLISQSPN